MLKILENLKNKINEFRNKEENGEIIFPDRLEIVFTSEAQEKGTLDDFNKEIKRYKNGVVVDRQPYSLSMLKAMMQTYRVPPLNLTSKQDQEFEFDEITALEGTITRVVKI